MPCVPRALNCLMVAVVSAIAAGAALADYPDRPVTIVVPAAAGVSTDKLARDFADALRKPLGNPAVLIENVPGASGTLGATRVAKAAPDGYTLLLAPAGLAAAPALYRHLPYRTLEDFEYLGMIDEQPMTLIGKPSLPADNVAELMAWLRTNKGKANLAHLGIGSASHLCGLMFQSGAKVAMQGVPYKGASAAMTDLIGGQVDLMCEQASSTVAQIEAGKVKAYAVTGKERRAAPALARLPTLEEAGLRGVDVTLWHGLYAPRGTPTAVLAKLNGALRQALRDAAFLRREAAQGAAVIDDARLDGAQHKRFVEQELSRWAPVIRSAGQVAD